MTRALIPVLLLAVLAPLAPAGQKYDEAKLIAILNSDAPPAQKAIPCKQLAICGTKTAVPALAKLLSSKELASWARIALEAIPDPAADEALRNAVPKLKGRLLVGVINSIGVRKDPKAVDILISKLRDSDQEVAAAAAEALGRIGGEKASAALKGALANTPPKVRSSVAYGCVLCAEKFLAEDKRQEAIALYDAVRKADVPPYRRVEAIRGAIVARGAEGVPLLLEQLRSPEKTFYWAGLRVARELPGAEASKALVAELAKAPPERKPKLLVAIADRGDPASMAAVLEVATSGAKALRIVALEALARVGDASCVPALVAAATSDDQQIATVAKAALARLEGTDVDAEIAARIPKAAGKSRAVLIEMAGRRCIWGALPAVARSIADPDPQVRKAAIAALSGIGTEKQLPDLVAAIQKAKDPTERAAVEKALTAICGRKGADPDRDGRQGPGGPGRGHPRPGELAQPLARRHFGPRAPARASQGRQEADTSHPRPARLSPVAPGDEETARRGQVGPARRSPAARQGRWREAPGRLGPEDRRQAPCARVAGQLHRRARRGRGGLCGHRGDRAQAGCGAEGPTSERPSNGPGEG